MIYIGYINSFAREDISSKNLSLKLAYISNSWADAIQELE
jgi:hypothetical protein